MASAAGYESVVIDRDKNAPASGLCGKFVCADALDRTALMKAFEGSDVVLPAIENDAVLESASLAANDMGIPFLHDARAYGISSSKLKSDTMFDEIGIPVPTPFPRCGFPLIAKPSGESGSAGVALIENQAQLDEWTRLSSDKPYVLQQYLTGPSYSVEVVGDGERYSALQVTELFMDEAYDCRMVVAPSLLAPEIDAEFREISLCIARRLEIKGVFDVEIILHEGKCKVLEIDARLPSQTPTVVYHSTGVNILEILCGTVLNGRLPEVCVKREKSVLYQHIYVDGQRAAVCGEHVMGAYGRLRVRDNFLGADIAITNWRHEAERWAATLIYLGGTRETLMGRQKESVILARELQNK